MVPRRQEDGVCAFNGGGESGIIILFRRSFEGGMEVVSEVERRAVRVSENLIVLV